MDKEFTKLPEEFLYAKEFDLKKDEFVYDLPHLTGEKEISIEEKINKSRKIIKLATSVSLTATSLGVGAVTFVPIIRPDVVEKEEVIVEQEEIVEEVLSEYGQNISGEWYQIGEKHYYFINDEIVSLEDTAVFDEFASYSILMEEKDIDNPILYLSIFKDGEVAETLPLTKIEDNLFYIEHEEDGTSYKYYVSLKDDMLEIKKEGVIVSNLSEEGVNTSQYISYYYYAKDNSDIVYLPQENIIPEEKTDEEIPDEEIDDSGDENLEETDETIKEENDPLEEKSDSSLDDETVNDENNSVNEGMENDSSSDLTEEENIQGENSEQ